MPIFLFTACEQDNRTDRQATKSDDGQHAVAGETLKPLVGGKEFSSDTGSYSISFPESWTINPGERGLVTGVTKPEEGVTVGASVTVFPGSLPSSMSAADVMTRYVAEMKKDGGFETTEEHHGKVNGRDAVWVVIDINHDGVLRRGISFIITKGTTAYILTCSTLPEKFDGVRPTFEGVLGTFKINN
jgi:hypothetical protein